MTNSNISQPGSQSQKSVSTYGLLLPYAAPYFAYVGIVSLAGSLPKEWSYCINIVAVTAILFWAWRRYVPFTGPNNTAVSVIWGMLAGIVGTVLWILMLMPFVEADAAGWRDSAFFLRLIAASILVPVFEELLMRGYIFRLAYQWDMERKQNKDNALNRALNDRCINEFEPGAWSITAVLVSTIAFMLGHQIVEWPAAFVYGLLMTLLWIKRKDLISCIVAHATTNFTLGLYVRFTQHWEFW